MARKPSPDKTGGDQRPADDDDRVEHPQRMPRPTLGPRRRDPYKNRMLRPDRMNGYDVKKG